MRIKLIYNSLNFNGLQTKIGVLFILLFCLILNGFSQSGKIRGSITDENGDPIAGANVVIWELQTGSTTNLEGLFNIPKVPDGTHRVRVTFMGYDTVYQEVTITDGKSATIKISLSEAFLELEGVEITDTKQGKIEKKEVTTGIVEVTPEEINIVPSLGTPDLAQYLQVLPGVINTGDQGGQLYIRGGTPIMNMVLLDGAVIYSPFHSIGLFSVFDTDYLRGVDVYSAAFPAQFGGRVSSVMDIKTRNGNLNNFAGKANVNPVTAGLMIEGPIVKNKTGPGGSSFLLSFRESHLNRTSPALYGYVSDSSALPFSFVDFYGKTTFTDGGNKVSLFGFSHNDKVDYNFPANYRWNSWGVGSQFMVLPGASSVIISGNFAFSSYKSGLQSASEAFPRNSLINGFNGGIRMSYILNTVDELSAGVTLLGFTTDYKFTNSFGLITQQVSNNTEIAVDVRYKKVFRKYGEDRSNLDETKDKFVLEPGIRLHYYNDHGVISPEPRLRMKYNLERVSISLGGGMYSQNLLGANSDRDVVNLFQGFLSAPPDLDDRIANNSLQLASHVVGGVEVEIVDNLEATLEGWLKDFRQLTNINRDKVFPDQPDYITETGVAYGFDVILKYQNSNWYGYTNYGWAKVNRENTTQVYPTVFDRRHNLNMVLAYQFGDMLKKDKYRGIKPKFTEPAWEFSMRWNLGSGFPFTQTQAFFEKIDMVDDGTQSNYVDQNGTLGIIYSDTINGGRLPYYHRFDISAKRRWNIKNKLLIEASVSAVNVYNRKNIFYFDRIRYAVVNQLPILPSAGVTIKF